MNDYFSYFRFMCRILSIRFRPRELEHLRSIIENDAVHWEGVVQIVNDYLVGPSFWCGLVDKGLDRYITDAPRQYFTEFHRLNQQRNRRLTKQLLEIAGALKQADLPFLLLKGASQLAQPIHSDIGYRMIGDLDILINPAHYPLALDALAGLDYASQEVSYDTTKLHHFAPLFRPGEYGVVELHRQAVHLRSLALLPTTKVWRAATPVEVDSQIMYVPSSSHAVLINLIHSQISDKNHIQHQINLRTLLDYIAIKLSHDGEIDWASIRRSLRTQNLETVLDTYELAAYRLLGAPFSADRIPGPSARLHYGCCMAAIRWDLTHRLAHRFYDFSKEKVYLKHGIGQRRSVIAAHQLRYFWRYVRHRLKWKRDSA